MPKSTLIKFVKIPYYILRLLRNALFCYLVLKKWDKTWQFRRLPIIRKHPDATITIGSNFVACGDPKKNSIGVFQKVILNALEKGAYLSIGSNVGVSGATISCENKISIGNNVLIGSGVLITDSDAHPIHPSLRNNREHIKTAPILIEDDVFIGARSIVLKGVRIGKGSVIGAGSVVSQNIPPMCIAAGNPAKVIKKIDEIK